MEQLSCFLGCLVYLIGFSSFEVGTVDGIIFQVPDVVTWSEAERTCQKYNGKLFQPSETSFDESLFSECNFNEALWVAATYINIINVGSAFRGDSLIRCEMCKIDDSCRITCLYKACGNRCKVLCVVPHTRVLHDRLQNWTEANQLCSEHVSDNTPSESSLFPHGHCKAVCIWTSKLIEVRLQTKIAPMNSEGECGILQNGTISFTSCNRYLHPLCERVATTTLEAPSLIFSEGNNSCRLINNTMTYMTTTQASRKTNGTNATIITSSTYGASTVANKITKQTTFGINAELSSVFVPIEASPHKSENGALIGGVAGAGVVLTIIIIIVVVFLLRRSKRKQNKNSTSEGPVNHDNVLKAKIQVNDAYDDINGEVTYSDQHTSIQIQNLDRESITYAIPSNVKGSPEIVRDKNSGILTNGDQMMTVLYSEVKKRPKAGQNLHNTNQRRAGDDEYDKINFDKSYTQQAEHLGDVYDQTNVNCEHREEYFENVYNKAEFYHKPQDMDVADVYDQANFHGGQQEKRSENAYSDEKSAFSSQISENVYDKADFHRRPQDESSGYL